MKSIRRTLLLWLFAGLSAGIVIAAGLLYLQAREEANQIFDYQMKQLAASLPTRPFAPVSPSRPDQPDMEKDIVIQIWDDTGLRIYHSHEQPRLPERAELGFANIIASNGAWRVYSAQQGDTVVQVAQPLRARREVAADMALKTVAPLLLLFPFLGGLIWITVSKGLSPVRRVAKEVQSRDASTLSPISDADLPEEVKPLTHALNDLLSRLDHAIDVQRAFVADAAHELRTPLTALKLQIQLAERATTEAERRTAFAELTHGFERATHLVQQLLTLARQEPGTSRKAQQPVDLVALAHNVVADLAPAANIKNIDLGIQTETSAIIHGDGDALRVLLGNLVDNAIRYTPDGGTVDVSIHADGQATSISVEDTGPGIPDSDLDRVFDRFYRVPGARVEGSGLGLAIVRQIADANDAQVTLRNTGHGLLACVILRRGHPAPV
jgi:two-component system OmpR family sensor kinase